MTRTALSTLALVLLSSLATPSLVQADASLGPHLGINFDWDDPLIGLEARFDTARLGNSANLQLSPSFSFYLVNDVTILNFSFLVPFEFIIQNSSLRPFVAPGLGIFFFDFEGHSNTDAKLALVGGLLFDLESVEPFFEMRAFVIDGSLVELVGGVLFKL